MAGELEPCPSSDLFDAKNFALQLRLALARRNVSGRNAAKEAGVSHSTFNRTCQKAVPPNVENYLRLVRWLGHAEEPTRPTADAAQAMAEAAEALRREAFLLLQNSEGCAANHYGNDLAVHGMPGWLADSRKRIEAAAAALATWEASRG